MSTKIRQLKTLLITGASSGIGFEIAKEIVESGQYRLILLGKSKTKLEEAANLLTASKSVSTYVCDFNLMDDIKKVIQRISQSFPDIYGLINNAGLYGLGSLSETSVEMWDEAFNVNLKAPFIIIQALLPLIKKGKRGGRIINISSTAGILPNHFALAYSVSKAGLIHLTKTVAKEVGKDGITVNCICPGIVRTPLHEKYHSRKSDLELFYSKKGASFPLGRIGEPQDVAAAAKFFLSDEASWITGEVMVIDGGRLLL